jgi:hypothetical protein
VLGEFTRDEIELLNAYHTLGQSGKKDLKDYLRYLMCKQYKREVMIAVFHNKLLQNLFHGLLFLAERDCLDMVQIAKRIQQIKDLYYGIFEQVHLRYSEIIEDLDSNEVVKEFARNSFANLERALRNGKPEIIRLEIIEFCQGFNKLSKRKDARNIVAV